MAEIWVWIKVPLRAVNRAIDALKDAVMRGHSEAAQDPKRSLLLRHEADQNEESAEALKKALRDEEGK